MSRTFVWITALLATTLLAQAKVILDKSQKFIGVEVAYTEVQGEGLEPQAKSKGASFGLHIGAQNDEWRTTVGISYFDNEDRNVERLFMGVDYLFLHTVLSDTMSLQPYLGLNVGYMNYETADGINADGFLYGAQLGAFLEINRTVDIDLEYRYMLSNAHSLDHTQEAVLSLHYLY